MSAASEDHGPAHAVRQGAGDRGSGPETSSPHTFRTHTSRQVGSARRERRGARRGHNEKSGPVRQERPSLVWRDFGPARESATSPHRSVHPESQGPQGPEGGGGARRGPSPEEPASASPAHHRPTLLSGNSGRRTTPRGERLTRGTEPAGWGRLSHHRVPAAGRGGVARGGRPTRATPRAPPPSGEPETGGGTAGRVSRAHTRAHTRAGAQAQAGGSRGKGTVRAPDGGPRPTAQIPACAQSPKVLSD